MDPDTASKLHRRFTRDELFSIGPPPVYSGDHLNEISFPLGGIGTGCIGLSGTGGLRDFEIFNRPGVGTRFPKTFPVLRVREDGKGPVAIVLEGPVQRPYTPLDGGRYKANGEGFPHAAACRFTGTFPVARVAFETPSMPVRVSLEAWNPFIPSDADASGFPIAVLAYTVENTSVNPVEASIAWSMLNIVGFTKDDCLKTMIYGFHEPAGQFNNMAVHDGPLRGVVFGNFTHPDRHPLAGSMALLSPDGDAVSMMPRWKQGPWFSAQYHFWNQLKAHGELEPAPREQPPIPFTARPEAGVVAVKKSIPPGGSATFTFYISWYFPNFAKYWSGWLEEAPLDRCPTWLNHYATRFEDAVDVALTFHARAGYLRGKTMAFTGALFGSTLPVHVLDAVSSTIAILKTPTCLRLEDGTFYGWEGCHPSAGCCEGSCTHVWGYQQALPFLFPSLARSMHDANYAYNFVFPDAGALEFRIQLPLGFAHQSMKPCADGQLGGIMHVYREWKLSGDEAWLRKTWPLAKRALDFAWEGEEWDEHKTGVLRGFQHNTYDVDFEGPNPMCTCYYLGALAAAAEMAALTGDVAAAREYMAIHDRGRAWVDENLFNGEYYVQQYDGVATSGGTNQVGPGCLVDQLVGQQLALVAGIGRFLDKDNVISALSAIFKHNWRPDMRDHENGARLYAVNDEAATVICTWPKGGRPTIPFPYADEVMNGFEYQFAVHCIMEGLVEEGLAVVKSIRDRYDGRGRNPWNEFECGHHYARSMAAHGLLVALAGFEFDKGAGHVGFTPVVHQDRFKTFWSLDGAWGTYEQDASTGACIITLLHGQVTLHTVRLGMLAGAGRVAVVHGDSRVEAPVNARGVVTLEVPATVDEAASTTGGNRIRFEAC